ncbi:MAG TPA: DUF309 domain-containing protein [Nitrososphaera sp.]|nr:DUF309 domain-containing protein [Nitrososphaera sp.]
MQRYMVHLHNRSHTPKDATALLYRARELAGSKVIVRDARVSKRYIEFDTSVPDGMDAGELTGRLEKISPLASCEQIVERHMGEDEAIDHAIRLFNDEKYWGAHEALESVWKGADGAEKSILNGIILVAAAFVHDEKDEPEICLSILQRARKKLDGASGVYHGIDIERVADLISKIINSGRIERFTI